VDISTDACFPDGLDPLDNNNQGARQAGLEPLDDFFDVFEGNLCAQDEDWICFPMGDDDGLELRLMAPESCGPIALELFNLSRLALLGTDSPEASITEAEISPEGLLYSWERGPTGDAFVAGQHCLRLRPQGEEASCEGYDLTLIFHRRSLYCTDQVEPNDHLAEALHLDHSGPMADFNGRLPANLDLQVPLSLRICPGDLDLYRFEADPHDALRAWAIAGADLEGELRLIFLDAEGQERGDAAGVNATPRNPEQALALAGRNGGEFYLKVEGGEQSVGDYELYLRRDSGAEGCVRDLHEPRDRNDLPIRAVELREVEPDRFQLSNGSICHPEGIQDEDWYRFPVEEAMSRLCIGARFRHRDGDLSLQVFRGGQIVGEQACVQHVDCIPEPDPFNPSPPELAEAACINNSCQLPIVQSDARYDGEYIAIPRSEVQEGEYLLRVKGAENNYDLSVTRALFSPDCEPDWQERREPNDDPRRATELGSGRAMICDAWICEHEQDWGDWYAIEVPAHHEGSVGVDRSVHLSFSPHDDGLLLLSAVDEMGRLVESFELSTNAQCINIRGGALPQRVFLGISADSIVDDGDHRIDYSLQILPVDLDRDERGACDALNEGLFSYITWPTFELE